MHRGDFGPRTHNCRCCSGHSLAGHSMMLYADWSMPVSTTSWQGTLDPVCFPTPPAHAPGGHGARWTQAPPARRWSLPRSAQCRGTAVPAAASTRPPARLRPTALPAGGAAPGWAPDGDTRSMGQHACIMSRRFAPCGSRCSQQMWRRAALSHDWQITQAGREDVEGGGAAHLGGQRGLSGSQSLVPAQRTVTLQRALSTLQAACKSSIAAGAVRAPGLQGRDAAGDKAPQPAGM